MNYDCRVGDRCCLSACVLILLAGVYRDAQNLGLHRPALSDFPERTFEEAHDKLASGDLIVENYLKEMEAPPGLLEAMMQVPPDQIRLLE
jgi:hypothetical protein